MTMALPLPASDLEWMLQNAAGDTQALRGQRIFITGGTGFIGSWLVEYLCHASAVWQLDLRITVLSREPAAFLARFPHLAGKTMLQLQPGNVLDWQADGAQHDVIIHAATDASAQLNRENPLLMADTIVTGTRRVLDYALAAGVRRVLMLSSGAVYGRLPAGITHVPEDYSGGPDPLDPYFTYAEAKRMAELLCALYAKQYGLQVPVARLFAFIGPRLPLDAHFAAGNFLRDALAGGPIRIAGDGTAVRSYLYAAEMVVWLLAVLVRGQSARAYNVGSDQAVSIRELAHTIAAATPTSPDVEILARAEASNPVNYYVPAIQRCADELGLATVLSLTESIRRTLSAWQCAGGGA